MFIVCLVVETLCLLLTLFAVVTNIRLTSLYCKIYYSLGFILPAYSSWILVFISLERFISTAYSTSKLAKLIGNKRLQMVSLFFVLIFCICYYCIDWLDYKLVYAVLVNDSSYVYYDSYVNGSISGCYLDNNLYNILEYMNTFYETLIPFVLMVIQSALIIYSMRVARQRISQSNSAIAKKRIQRDFEFARTILLLDLRFILFHLPHNLATNYITLFLLTNPSVFLQYLQNYLYYFYKIGYAINFLVYLIFNKNFRAEFIALVKQSGNSKFWKT